MFDKPTMNYLKENIFSDKQQFLDVAKAKDCSQLLIDSYKYQIHFLREEVKVKNHLIELAITSNKSRLQYLSCFQPANWPPLAETF